MGIERLILSQAKQKLEYEMKDGWFSSVNAKTLEAAIRKAHDVGVNVEAAMQKLSQIAPDAAQRIADEKAREETAATIRAH